MAKKSSKAKKIVKKRESASSNIITVGDIPVSSSDYPETPEQKPKKNFKPPIGTAGNPRKLGNENFDIIETAIPVGSSETYYIEVQEQPSGKAKPKWRVADYGCYKSLSRAEKIVKDYRRDDIADHQHRLEREWLQENTHNQQSKKLIQFTVTQKTSKKAVDELVASIEEEKKKLKENPPAKMPDFSKEEPEYPKYRVRRRTFSVDDEIVKE